MVDSECRARWADNEFVFPAWENWNEEFITPEKVRGEPISKVWCIVTGKTDSGHHCAFGESHVVKISCYKKGHMSWCTVKNEDTNFPCGIRCPNNKGICDTHSLLIPFEAKAKNDKDPDRPVKGRQDTPQRQDVQEQEATRNKARDDLVLVIGDMAPAEESTGEQEEGQGQVEELTDAIGDDEEHEEEDHLKGSPVYKSKYEGAPKPSKKDKMLEKRRMKAVHHGKTLKGELALRKRKGGEKTKKDGHF